MIQDNYIYDPMPINNSPIRSSCDDPENSLTSGGQPLEWQRTEKGCLPPAAVKPSLPFSTRLIPGHWSRGAVEFCKILVIRSKEQQQRQQQQQQRQRQRQRQTQKQIMKNNCLTFIIRIRFEMWWVFQAWHFLCGSWGWAGELDMGQYPTRIHVYIM